jgi:outer membrane receptor protein involved in Fe transport
MDRSRRCVGWTVLALLALWVPALDALQQSAIIRGLVSAVDGEPVNGATVTLLDRVGTSLAATHTDANGRFQFEEVPPGSYTVFAEATPQRSDARIVTVQGALPIDVQLTLVDGIAESVIVRAESEAPPVTTRITIAGETLRQMPTRLTSRAVQQALATLPGFASEDNGLLHVRGVDDGFLYVEDGVPVYDRLDNLFGIAADAASIGSMNVLTGYIPPEYGLKSGAVIEVQSSTATRTGWTATFDTGIGSDALRVIRALGAGPLSTRTNLGVSVASERSDRFLDPVHPANFHNEGGVLSGDARLSVLASDNDLLKVHVTGARSDYQVPHGELQEAAGQDQRQRLLQDSQSGSWQRFWSDSVVSQLSLYRRHIDASLRSSPRDTPLSASSDRRQSRLGGLAALTYERNRHTLKFGFDAARLALREDFNFAVTDLEAAEAADISEHAGEFTIAEPFRFDGGANRKQWAFYVQDTLRATDRLTADFGVRFDRTNLLIPASQWSPRIGVAYSWPESATTFRASLNRFFQPPQPEHLLLSSSAAARALSPFAGAETPDVTGGAELEPERQFAWEVGVDQWFGGAVRLDAAFWSRHVRNYADPNVFFGTTIIFPNSVASGHARGFDLRLEVARFRALSSYVSYTLSKVEQVGPINGGLFLEENILEIGPGTRFTPDHDQRHAAAAGVTYVKGGFSASLTAQYQSGTPLEVDEDALVDVMERPGAALVNFETGRVRPRTVFDLSVAQILHQGRRTETSVRVGVLNLTNRDYALNFANPFSGTHFGASRSFRAELRIGLH